MQNQGNKAPPKSHNNLLVTEHKDMEMNDLPD